MAEPDPNLASTDEWGHVGYDLAAETCAFQSLLEGHRADPDNDELFADMKKAEAAMETAWLRLKPTL